MALQTILDWNDTLLDAIREASMAPPIASRAMAVVQAAVFDAVNAANGSPYEGYAVRMDAGSGINEDAAAIAASYHALKSLFSSFGDELDSRYNDAVAALDGQSGVSAGLSLGQSVASALLASRANDGATRTATYTPTEGAGNWEPTPPSYAAGLLPQWPTVKPWTMIDGSQFRPDGPPALNSSNYASAFNEVKAIGSATSTTRTEDQTEIAHFWADGAGTATPPGHWQEIAQTLATAQNLSTIEGAKLFALLSLSVADAAIVAWDAKYAYGNWRPVTAIAEAADDGNDRTDPEAGWLPLLTTPPFPDYISGHSTFSAAAGSALENYFGTGVFTFSTTSDGLPDVTRTFTSIQDAVDEAGISRIYGGIHWNFSNTDGKEAGDDLGDYVSSFFLLPQQFLGAASNVQTLSVGGVVTRAQAGNDSITGSAFNDKIYGGSGGDTLLGGAEGDVIYGGDAVSDAADGSDSIRGGAGEDALYGNSGNDTLFGGDNDSDTTDGADYLHGGSGLDLIYGNAGDDLIYGSAHSDTAYGGLGSDVLFGGSALADTTDGADILYGGLGTDTLYGNSGNDTIYGGIGIGDPSDSADVIYAGLGDDSIYGNGGADSIQGGKGNDVMYGGGGNDVFLIGNSNGRDLIVDFAGAGATAGDVLYVLSHINGTSYSSASTIALLIDVQGADAIIWFDPSNNVTISGGAGLNASDIVMVSSESF